MLLRTCQLFKFPPPNLHWLEERSRSSEGAHTTRRAKEGENFWSSVLYIFWGREEISKIWQAISRYQWIEKLKEPRRSKHRHRTALGPRVFSSLCVQRSVESWYVGLMPNIRSHFDVRKYDSYPTRRSRTSKEKRWVATGTKQNLSIGTILMYMGRAT